MEAITGSVLQYKQFTFDSTNISRFVYDPKGVCSKDAYAMFLDVGGPNGQ